MSCDGDKCQVENLIIDISSSYLVCTRCGVVKENLYTNETRPDFSVTEFFQPNQVKVLENIKDILDRIHISAIYAQHICKYYFKFYKSFNLKAIVFSCYKILNEHGYNISLKDLLNINGLGGQSTFSTQKSNENVLVNTSEMLNKYCAMLNLSFKDTSLIKEMIIDRPLSGHTPLTTIAGNIYLYCKSQNRKISIKKIAEITQVSNISIQRYIKNVTT